MRFILFLSSFIVLSTLKGQTFTVLSNWKTENTSSGVSIAYRWVNFHDTLITRQLMASFIINNTLTKIPDKFRDSETLENWAAGVKNCNVHNLNETEWITYTLYSIPWPLEQKDLVSQYKLTAEKNIIRLSIKPIPGYYAMKQDITRVDNYIGEWEFKQTKSNEIQVIFKSISFEKPMLPKFIQDPIIQRVLIESCLQLKLITEADKS